MERISNTRDEYCIVNITNRISGLYFDVSQSSKMFESVLKRTSFCKWYSTIFDNVGNAR